MESTLTASDEKGKWNDDIHSFIREHSGAGLVVRCCRQQLVRKVAGNTAPFRWKEKVDIVLMPVSCLPREVRRIIRSWEQHLCPGARIIICDNPSGIEVMVNELTGRLGDFRREAPVDGSVVLSVDVCPHHWDINREDVGFCILCRRERDFRALRKEHEGLARRKALRLSISNGSEE